MKILVTGAWRCTKEQLDSISALGHEIIFMQEEREEMPIKASEIECVICNGLFLHHKIESFVNLKYIQLTSAGFDRVPMDYVKEHGIIINNAKGVYSIPMAEMALCGILQIYKQSDFFRKNQEEHSWERNRGLIELFGKSVGIVGCGNVGTECAKRLKAFGCNVVGYDLFPYSSNEYDAINPMEAFDDGIGGHDVVLLTLPLTDETRHFMNCDRFSKMKSGSVIVNIARGGVVDTEAMINSLKTHIRGAVLDVFEEEPLNNLSPLWDMENVILTPHNSFVGEGNSERLWKVIKKFLENI